MKYSQYFVKTEKMPPKDADNVSSKYLLQGGFIDKTMAGSYSYLPMGFLVLEKIKKIIRKEFAKAGVSEILMPILQPAELWKKSGRYEAIKDELWKLKNRALKDFVLSMTAEEVVTDIASKHIKSYKDLPAILNQIQTKIRDEARPKGGLIRLKEFIMQDAYSFDADEEGLDISFNKMVEAYQRIFKRCGLKIVESKADVGPMGGSDSREYHVLSSAGEDSVVVCGGCGYAANQECAECLFKIPDQKLGCNEEMEKVKTPNMVSVGEVSEFLQIETEEVVKTIVFKSGNNIILALVRGDFSLSQKKLEKALGKPVELAAEGDFDKAGLVAGYVSPVKLDKKFKVIADYSIKTGRCFVAGGNERDTHYTNVSLKDLNVDEWADLIEVGEGNICKKCGGKLAVKKGIEIGHAFKLGDKYSKTLGAKFIGKDGKEKYCEMGCYGIGLDRLMATIIEANHDEKGIIWPKEVAPFSVYLFSLSKAEAVEKATEQLSARLEKAGTSVLYDDRAESSGVKFADADLLGSPYRIILSDRTLKKNSVEVKERNQEQYKMVELDKVEEWLKSNSK
jgi:prolyl-tRNA synthetase